MTKDLTGIAKLRPICGSKRIYMSYPNIDVIYSVHIQCADCGLNGYKNFYKVDIDDAIERTIKYWNTRAESGGKE